MAVVILSPFFYDRRKFRQAGSQPPEPPLPGGSGQGRRVRQAWDQFGGAQAVSANASIADVDCGGNGPEHIQPIAGTLGRRLLAKHGRDIGYEARIWYSIWPQILGVWRSLVAHFVRDEGVGGSNPLTPTKSL
jgi:hypothetical protein